jgi:IQ domain-containing protein H
MIEPNGEVQVIGSFDKFMATEYVSAGCFFPQQSLKALNLVSLCQSVGTVLYEKGMIGHVTIDLVAFPNPTDPSNPNMHPLFWAVDINNDL